MARSPASVPRLALLAWGLGLVLPASGWAWGFAAHHYIAQNYSKHLPSTMDGLRVYDALVDQKVTDPDTRRPSTPGEGPRHFIDIDYYPEFFTGTLSHDRATLEAQYGAATVFDWGIVPWAVGEVVGTLTIQFATGQWSATPTTIADLCHYVGDACVPFHCTKNYDGQFTGNNGIHSRYESSMMSTHIGDLVTPPMQVTHYPNVVDAMFAIVDDSWAQVATVLSADNAAKAASGGAINSTYYNSLWASTETLTRERINTAALATASFVYTAWVNAGSPFVPGSSSGIPPRPVAATTLSAGPSPFRDALNIAFDGSGPLTVDVFDLRGALVQRIVSGAGSGGTVSWTPAPDVSPGLYFVRLTGAETSVVRRVTRLH